MITLLANKESFTFVFPISIPVFSSCLIVLARSCSIMLNTNGENNILTSFPNLSLLPLCMMLGIGTCRCSLSGWRSSFFVYLRKSLFCFYFWKITLLSVVFLVDFFPFSYCEHMLSSGFHCFSSEVSC